MGYLKVQGAAVLLLSPILALSLAAQSGESESEEPPGPAPRNAEGKILLGPGPDDEAGIWLGEFGGLGTFGTEERPLDLVPWQPWSRALYVDREGHRLEPHARCKVSGVSRQFQTPYGVEIVEFPELQRVYIFDIGGPHTFRTIYLDGRSHPDNLQRSGYGHSIGWWEGDTLVVDTVGFDESFWLDRMGIPHTEALHTLERFTRTDYETIEYEVTIDDSGAFTQPWSGSFDIRYVSDLELFEYVCQQANYAHELMLGDYESVDRTSPIVP